MFHSVVPIEGGILGRYVITSAQKAGATVSGPRLGGPQSEEHGSLRKMTSGVMTNSTAPLTR